MRARWRKTSWSRRSPAAGAEANRPNAEHLFLDAKPTSGIGEKRPPSYLGAIPRLCSIGVMSGSLPRKALNMAP
jgi:hypothetical protein